MQKTENYGLNKPEDSDFYNVDEMIGQNMEIIDGKMKELDDTLGEMKTSFQAGCDTIVAACATYGSAPTSNSPDDIASAIEDIYVDRYAQGVEDAEPVLQSKSATLNATTKTVTLKPDSGYDGLSQATVSITTQEKTQSVTSGTATVTPDSGKVLSKVTVNGPTSYAGTTKDASAVSSDDSYTYLSIPANGYYSTASKIRTANSNLAKGGAVFNASGVAVANNSYVMVPVTAHDDTAFAINSNVLTCKKAGTLHYLITGRCAGNRSYQYVKIYQNGTEVNGYNFFGSSASNAQCWANGSVSVAVGDLIQVRITSEGDNAASDLRYASGMITLM